MAPQKESRPMQNVAQLELRGAVDVVVKRGAPSMTVIAQKPEDVITEISAGVLRISNKPTMVIQGGNIQINGIDGNVALNHGGATQVFYGSVGEVAWGDVVIAGGRIAGRAMFSSSAVGQVPLVEVTLPELPLAKIAGSGNLRLEDVSQDEIKLEITGSGTIQASGQVKYLSAHVTGSGDIKAKGLQAEAANLRVSGSGDIKARATQELKARVSGSGDITVLGSPAIRDTHVSGSGEILCE